MPYCTAQQAGHWLGPNNATNPFRSLSAVDPGSDALVLDGHNMSTGDMFEVTARAGTVATGLEVGVEYFAIVINSSRWQVAATLADAQAGTEIGITDQGENMGVLIHIPWDRLIAEEDAVIDDMIMASALPLPDGATVPPLIGRYSSLLVAKRAAMFTGQTSLDLQTELDRTYDQFDKYYLKGKPIRTQAPPPANTAVRTPATSGAAVDRRGWKRRDCSGAEVLP
jgi:hypothetical protein